MALLHWKQC